MPALCNDTWTWFAVNVPYNAINQNGFNGDIDIIVKRPRYFMNRDSGFTYRGFQVKTIVVSKTGQIRSAKRGAASLRGIKKQLDVLKSFGCEQIFLLEIYILERGFSSRDGFPSDAIRKDIIAKAEYLKNLGYGYVVTAEEPSIDKDEVSGGVFHFVRNVLLTSSNQIGLNFQKLADDVDSFLADPETKKMLDSMSEYANRGTGIPLTSYCSSCKKLTLLIPITHSSHICGWCKRPAY
jgi:hypothetical protein